MGGLVYDNSGSGIYIDYGSGNCFMGMTVESNGDHGVEIDHTFGVQIIGGYYENNTTSNFDISANATRIQILTPRSVTGSSHITGAGEDNAGNIFLFNLFTKIVNGSGEVFDLQQQPHIVDANGTLADITTKFNTLLSDLETIGILASS